jgi:photosynthetic reaction center cytochrome c subunit
MGDPLKINCGTCHQGAYQPLLGAEMVKDFPSLTTYDGATKAAYVDVIE